MKFTIAFAAVLAVASAQFPYSTIRPQFPSYSTIRPPVRYSTIAPIVLRPSPSPTPIPVNSRVVLNNDQNANILRIENEINPDGSYSHGFETDNGISAQAQGVPRDFGGNPPVIPVVSQGSFAWTSPEGQPIAITYIADENGYQPSGDAIPTPPAIPEAILRALQYIGALPQKK